MDKKEYVAALRELANFVEERDFPDSWRGWYGEDSFQAPTLLIQSANKSQFGKLHLSWERLVNLLTIRLPI